MNVLSKSSSVLMPGGLLLLGIAALLHSGLLTLPLSAVNALYYLGLAGGLLVAWRFHSSRVFLALVTLFLTQQGILLFTSVHAGDSAVIRLVLESAAVTMAVNFVALSIIRERRFTSAALVPAAICLFVESVIVAIVCSGVHPAPSAHHHLARAVQPLSGYLWAAFAIAGVILLSRFLMFRRPVDIGLFWSLAAFYVGITFSGTGTISTAYFATSALILGFSIIETSYLLAYHDELTSLPSRRGFNDALLDLQTPYSIAVVDIDHFKSFNDTYGHDTGDEVLRLVAAKLARVSGGGKAYRCGGEEFSILFSGKTTKEILGDLEQLRSSIEAANFCLRGSDRRKVSRGPDRRTPRTGRRQTGRAIRQLVLQENSTQSLSVTVSIGVATSAAENSDPQQVIRAADHALYRAKSAGRNRVETASPPRRRTRAKTAGIA